MPSGTMLESNQLPLDYKSNNVCCKYSKSLSKKQRDGRVDINLVILTPVSPFGQPH